MDQPYHMHEENYTALEAFNFKKGAWKTYDERAFHMVKENIGRATTGNVHLMMHGASHYLGIMKVIPTSRRLSIQGELSMLQIARESPFLIRLIDGLESKTGKDDNYFIFLEYAPFKSLDHLTQSLKGIGSSKAKLYAMEIASALEFLHNKNIMHRDVKPENVFIRLSGHAALGDLGLTMDATNGSRQICGTFLTRPPEVWARELYSLPIDVWMFGVSLYNIICNKWPFMSPGRDRQIEKVQAGNLSFDAKFCDSSNDLIKKCCHVQARSRPTIKEVLHHEYFKPPLPPPFTPQELLHLYKYDDQELQVVTKLVSTH